MLIYNRFFKNVVTNDVQQYVRNMCYKLKFNYKSLFYINFL
jgi:hypothetical protein